jgi:hypothetical protein
MSAADRMAVRTTDGKIRSVARRVGLGMIARNQAKAAPHQRVQRTGALGNRPASAVTVVTAEAPELTAQTSGVVDLADHEPPAAPVEFEEDDSTALPVDAPSVERPRGNAARKFWAEFARVHGVEVTGYMTRDQIRDAVDAKFESDRMSRPAHEGGRPATPEDEPVTEDMVTSVDPGERTA